MNAGRPNRSASLAVQNPIFALPGIRETLGGLAPGARAALRGVLVGIQVDAAARAAESWRKHKAPMACYWKAVGVYAGHIARAQVEAAARSEREELLAALEAMVAAANVETVDPLVMFASIEKARAVIEKSRGVK